MTTINNNFNVNSSNTQNITEKPSVQEFQLPKVKIEQAPDTFELKHEMGHSPVHCQPHIPSSSSVDYSGIINNVSSNPILSASYVGHSYYSTSNPIEIEAKPVPKTPQVQDYGSFYYIQGQGREHNTIIPKEES